VLIWSNFLRGNPPNSGKTVTLQNRIFKVMVAAQPRTSHNSLLKQSEILPVPCQCMLSLTSFIINNQEIFQESLSIHNINTINDRHLHKPNAKVFFKQNIVYHKFFSTMYVCMLSRTRNTHKNIEINPLAPEFPFKF